MEMQCDEEPLPYFKITCMHSHDEIFSLLQNLLTPSYLLAATVGLCFNRVFGFINRVY